MKRKIIEFITNLSDGGAENLIKDYALLIDKSKFDICVVTIRNYTHTAVYKTLKDNDIKIIPVYPKWNIIIKIFNKILGRYYINWRLKSIFNQETAEVIHAHLYTLKYLHRIKENLAGIKLFYTCHSLPRVYLGGVEGAIAKELHQSNGLRIIALHEDMRKEINELLDIDDTVIIRNGIDFNRYINAEEGGKNVRDMLRIPSDAFVLGHVGRFHYVKNHDLLVKIFVQFSKYNPNAFLLMIGDGDEKERIRQKLIHLGMEGKFLILSNRTDVPELMRAMSFFSMSPTWATGSASSATASTSATLWRTTSSM